jgi:putative oxidoreductase
VAKNPVYLFFHSPGNVGPLILRLAVGGIFFYHGTQMALGWFGGDGWQGTVEAWASPDGFGLPVVLTSLVIVMELAICLSLAFGFLTRIAGLGVVAVMSGALFLLGRTAEAFSVLEFPVIVWAAGLALVCLGGGALSMDRAISKNLLPIVG